MKNITKLGVFVGLMCLLVFWGTGCSETATRQGPHILIVLETYEEDVDANDGAVEKDWRTLCKTMDDSRVILYGKWGAAGDTLKTMYYRGTWNEAQYWEGSKN